ncbi:hypothetical protein CC1G_08143 [Coprinopsis cinerea okayama7|uniref:MYND-type domain-containing protein n=1 Tax=Coprinopsis cinerea (strain Okayama-7 / 130 / ATCC MYA-4618 / FGSC 9003) TaxID=240176 RepID=A8NZ30_COPC7|nr:hypothetical protein CC1G_08143 [Coprinopsis cinerea okayama7\|eukprot:XP_001837589.1 hypothetical protein CC1G_08143 [Coprinopsis cinerea okayama7\
MTSVQILESALKPEKPLLCGAAIHGLILDTLFVSDFDIDLDEPDDDKLYETFVKNSEKATQSENPTPRGFKLEPEIWQMMYNFLFHPRSKKETEKLLRELSDCLCLETVMLTGNNDALTNLMTYHNFAKTLGHDTDHFQKLMAYLREVGKRMPISDKAKKHFEIERSGVIMYMFTLVLDMLEYQRAKPLALQGYKDRSSWPTNLDDLFPHGPDKLVQSFITWYQVLPDPMLFRLFAQVLRLSRERIIPSMVQFRFATFVFDAWKSQFDLFVSILEKDGMDPANEEWFSPMGKPYFIHAYAVSKGHFRFWLSTVTMSETFSSNHLEDIFTGCEVKALQLLSLTCYITDKDSMGQDHPKLVQDNELIFIAHFLYRYLYMHRYPDLHLLLHPAIVDLDGAIFPWPMPESDEELVLDAILRFRTEGKCKNKGCDNSMHTSGKSLQRCASCGVVAYCGKQCQVKDWKNPEFPHKTICPLLTELVRISGDDEGNLFNLAERRRKAEASDKELARADKEYEWMSGEKSYESYINFEEATERVRAAGYPKESLETVKRWVQRFPTRFSARPTKHINPQRELKPGYPDYEEKVEFFVKRDMGGPAHEPDRSKRWPHEGEVGSVEASS